MHFYVYVIFGDGTHRLMATFIREDDAREWARADQAKYKPAAPFTVIVTRGELLDCLPPGRTTS